MYKKTNIEEQKQRCVFAVSYMLFCASLSGSRAGVVTISGSAPCRAHSGRT